ncbi:unnamed protein product [Mycena citricolor]|uniref:RNA polymerase II elongation factor ELL N-terminal domain-containing protein n=1 Tax=Mycena citricolor TaxID=2018698 RepID=A0AAD2HWI7_9AGAR|nr:unnamed protein product [Mycena citricolor]
MSLPANVKLSVQGHSRPGDTLHSVPKQAMIVKMSEDALLAIQGAPRLEFVSGPELGFVIGGQFFPMRSTNEGQPHDLYLRASSAAKPMAPLKLYANITGRFTVERDLDKIQTKMRSATRGAKEARHEIMMLDKPLPTAQKKKKAPGTSTAMFRNPVQQPRASASTRPVSPSPPVTTVSSAVRFAVLKFMAIKERTLDEVLAIFPRDDDDSRRREIHQLLSQQMGEPGKRPGHWTLRPEIWKEVRPYEWTGLDDKERMMMARTARLVLSNLQIPETDPLWTHVNYRPEESALVGKSGGKRGISGKELKEKKKKPKPDPKAEIAMRDGSRPVARVSDSRPSDSVVSETAVRRTGPGSGYRAPRAGSHEARISVAVDSKSTGMDSRATVKDMKPAKDTKSDARLNARTDAKPSARPEARSEAKPNARQDPNLRSDSKPTARGPVDVRTKSREPPRPSVNAKAVPPIPPPTQTRPTKETAPDTLKRKQPVQDVTSAEPAKRRKTDEGLLSRAAGLPNRPETSLARASHQGRSSLPARPVTTASTAKPVQSAASSKRREPIYTSSEDEGEIRPASRPKTELRSIPSSSGSAAANEPGRLSEPSRMAPIPASDRSKLRTRYNETYLDYLSNYQRLFAEQAKIERLLSKRDGSTASDSELDDVMSPEEITKRKNDHLRYERELEKIRVSFKTSAGEIKSE